MGTLRGVEYVICTRKPTSLVLNWINAITATKSAKGVSKIMMNSVCASTAGYVT